MKTMSSLEIVEGFVLIGFSIVAAVLLQRRARRSNRRALFEELLADYSRVGSIANEPELEEKIESYRRRFDRA